MSGSRIFLIALCAFIVAAFSSASLATTWSLSADWSGTSNPSGVWSYGYTSVVGVGFTPYTSAGTNIWGNVYAVGRVMKTQSTGVVSLWNAQNPDHVDRQAVARWTSPISGRVHVWGRFSYEDTSTQRGIAYVLHNSTQEYAKTIMNWDFPFCWDGEITVSVGDTIDFVVGADPASPFPSSYAAFDTWATITTDPVGTVSGTVTADVSGGQPVPYAVIRTSDGKYVTACGTDGSYSLSLPAGTYTLIAGSANLLEQQAGGVTVSDGGITDQDFLLAGATISGTVTSDATGSPIAGASVRVAGEGAFSTTTNSAGQYTLKVQPGIYSGYNVLASAAAYDPIRSTVSITSATSVVRNFALRSSSAGQQIGLPAPVEWGEPPSAPVPPGDSFPVSFVSTGTLPLPDAPAIAGWNETVKPDESFTLTGARFTTRTGSDAGTDTTVWVWARTSTGGVLRQAKIWKVTSETILATMPDDIPYGAYLVWVENSIGASAPVIFNRTRTTYVGPLGNVTYPGATIRIMGRNISHNRGTSPADSYVYVQAASGGVFTACTVTKVDPYMVEFVLPGSLAHGDYKVFVHNGHGGIYGWSDPLAIVVQAQWVRGSAQVTLTPSGVDDTAAIQSAIDAMTANPNGGTVNFAAGTFVVSDDIYLRSGVELKGAGMDVTYINLQMAAAGNPFQLMGAHSGFSDLTLREMPGYAYIGYSGVVTYNWNLIATYTTFKRVKFAGTASAPGMSGPVWVARLAEMSDCVFYTTVGTFGESWIHNCTSYGSRNNSGWTEAPFLAGYKRDIFEYNHIETPNWPYDPSKPYPYNYKNNLTPEQWGPLCFSWRIALTYCNEYYAAHNTSKDVATQDNKGEVFLFHPYPGLWFGNVVSTVGLTTNLRTDGLVDGQVVSVKNYDGQMLTGGGYVPDGGYYSALDPMGGYQDVIHSDSALLRISIVSGKGMGQYRRAVAHTPFSVTVDRPWLVQPDSTSIATISRLYVDNTLYKNDINAFPAGYDRVVGAQVAGYDGSIGIGAGNLWGLSMEGNVSHRTSTGWGIGIGQTSPQCWNELRDEKAYDCALNGFTMYTLMGEQGPGPGPLNCIGNVFRGGEVTVIGGSPIQTAVVGASVQNGIGSTFESITINAKRGIEYAGINGPAPYGTSVPSSYYGSAIFRKCNITVYNNPAFQPGVPQPVYFASYSDGQLLSRNTYSGSSQIYTGSGLTQTPVALGRCARFKGYVGGHLDPVVVPISNPGIQTMSWTATPSDSWITATIGASPTMAAEGDAGRLVVYVDASGMSAGRHWGYVTVSTGIKTAKIGVCVDLDAGPPAQQSPVASFTSSPAGGIAPVTANFDAGGSSDADGVIVSYSWDFGDGTGTAGVSASHTYSVAGVYLVTLTVTDNSGNTGIAVATITAGAPLTGVSISGNPAPPIESGTPVTLTATPIGGYNVSYKFLIRSGNGWSVLRDYSTDPAAAWTPSSSGCYAIRVLARSAGSANAYDVIGEIAYPVGLVPSAGMRLWLRADSGIGFDDLGKVSSWADQSGAGNNVSQSTESIRPAFVTNGFDGKPTVRFTGPSQMLQTSGLVLTGTTPFTAFTAAKFNSFPVGSYQYLWWNGMNSQTAGYGCYISTTVKLRSAWGSQSYYLTDTSSASAGTWYKMTSRYSSGSHQAWLNGTYLGSNAKTDSNFNLLGVFTVGNNGPTPSQGFYGDIGEILIYDRALSDTERANVETYLLSKWSPITAVTRERLLDVKALPDQTVVSITLPKVVTAASGVFSGGVYYICEPDRTCGLRVTGGPSVALWENVTLTGTVGTDANGERVLMVSTVDTRSSGTELGTLGMMNKVCGPSGQFVRVWGKVVGTGSGYFTLDDGSASPIRVETSGLIIPPSVIVQTGQYAGASGISGRGAGGLTVVRPRSDSDIRVY